MEKELVKKEVELLSTEYLELSKTYSSVYKFVITYSDYMNKSRDYGTGEFLPMMEAHVLTDIYDNQGITVSELAEQWNRTTSALSQTVRKLIKKELAYRVNSEDNGKIFFLYPTEKGKVFCEAHKEYDVIGINLNRKILLEKFSKEELITFYKILNEYTEIIKDKM